MAERAGVELHDHIGLVLQEGFRAVDCDLVAKNVDLTERRGQRVGVQSGRVDLRLGDANVAMVVRVTGLVAEGDVAVDVVLELHRPHVHVGLQIVAMLKAIIVAALHRGRTIEEPGDAVVRRVVGALMQIAECEAGGRAQSEGQRGSDAVAAVLGDVPSRRTSNRAP